MAFFVQIQDILHKFDIIITRAGGLWEKTPKPSEWSAITFLSAFCLFISMNDLFLLKPS